MAIAVVLTAGAQDNPYKFTDVKSIARGETEDQCATGTCWSFATVSFLEAELIRMGKGNIDLSEMYNVRMTYPKKAADYVRYQGKNQFGPGALAHDAINVMAEYGIVPESAYTGLEKGVTEHDHGGLDALLESTLKTALEKKLVEQGQEWKKAIEGILDAYLGRVPKEFEYSGKTYTPASFRDAMGLKASDYVSITSFTHHPYYTQFVLEVPDNFSHGMFFNVQLDELTSITEAAIANGYSVAWDADVSEKTFSFRNAMAIMPSDDVKPEDYFKKIVAEKHVTADQRQEAFETLKTTDDHLMHITGTATDQNGTKYFTVKNSWGKNNPSGGYQYVSYDYFRAKTVAILLHRNAVPQDIRKKTGI
ncbi:MAG: hypothetical protein RL220_935 [Bacteroidota bacterium]